MAQLNEWLSISKTSGTGNAEITLTASSYEELTQRTESLVVKGQSENKKVYVNVIQTALVPSATLDSYEITAYTEGTYTNGITSNVPWTAVVNGNWITIDKTQGESGYTPLSITVDASTETRSGSIIFNAEGVVLTLRIYQIYSLKESYFWIEFEDVGGTISDMDARYVGCVYSFDGSTWETTPNTLSMGNNTFVYFRGNEIQDRRVSIKMNNVKAKIGGNISSLSPNDNEVCRDMFKDNINLTDASELILPWSTLFFMCYAYMFAGCTNLKTAPKLPATILAGYCYTKMFDGCTSLTTAPELPATTLASDCYKYMFCGCTSLTTAPELPATALAGWCYAHMFENCTSLTTAPELPATILAEKCYYDMFRGCTSLVNIPSILPSTTLTEWCYHGMFWGCTSLTTAPELPATTLTIDCYEGMFYECTSLVNIPSILPAITLSDNCYQSMFYGCTSLTTAPVLPATTLAEKCYSYMFRGCTSLVNIPSILPATTLADSCYLTMFYGCKNITTAPELPATTLASNCYEGIFYGCKKLTYIKMLATDISASSCLNRWVENVSSTGTFIKHPVAVLPTGISGIPSGWTVETATE